MKYNVMTKRFICTFINKRDSSNKSCMITLYRDCHPQQSIMAQANSTDSEITLAPNDLEIDKFAYCYVVVAKNDTFILNINGTIGQSELSNHY